MIQLRNLLKPKSVPDKHEMKQKAFDHKKYVSYINIFEHVILNFYQILLFIFRYAKRHVLLQVVSNYLSLNIKLEFLIANVFTFPFRLMLVGTMLVLLSKNILRKLLRLKCLKLWKKLDY